MDWSASRARRLSSAGRCGACRPRASTTTCCLCGSRGACECVKGKWGATSEGGGDRGSLGLPPTSLPLPSKPGGSGEGAQTEKAHWPSGLGPQPGGASPGPYSALQTSGLLSRLPLHPLLGPEPQAEESQLERRGGGDHSDGHASSPSCLSVCLSSSLCLWRSPGPAGCYVSTVTSGAASGWWAAVRSPTG